MKIGPKEIDFKTYYEQTRKNWPSAEEAFIYALIAYDLEITPEQIAYLLKESQCEK